MMQSTRSVGEFLRDWRQRRRMSQLDLACEADISARHLSFVETGRSTPSREMVLHLAERLDIPLRERNVLLTAAGYAPVFSERPLEDPAMHAARKAVELVLKGHEPYPAIAVDRHWNLVAYNNVLQHLLVGVDAPLLEPPINVMRLSLHPGGLAPRIANLIEWREHLLERLRRQIELSADPVMEALMADLLRFPVPIGKPAEHEYTGIVVPLQIVTPAGVLSFLSTITIFGTPVDITLSELALESFYPADAFTGEALRRLAEGVP